MQDAILATTILLGDSTRKFPATAGWSEKKAIADKSFSAELLQTYGVR
jgi:hypothetical protein